MLQGFLTIPGLCTTSCTRTCHIRNRFVSLLASHEGVKGVLCFRHQPQANTCDSTIELSPGL